MTPSAQERSARSTLSDNPALRVTVRSTPERGLRFGGLSSGGHWLLLVGLIAGLLCVPFFRTIYGMGDEGYFMIVTDNNAKAKKILTQMGAEVKTEEVIAVELANRPGELQKVALAAVSAHDLARAGYLESLGRGAMGLDLRHYWLGRLLLFEERTNRHPRIGRLRPCRDANPLLQERLQDRAKVLPTNQRSAFRCLGKILPDGRP